MLYKAKRVSFSCISLGVKVVVEYAATLHSSSFIALLCILLPQIFAPPPASEYLFERNGPTQCMHTPNVDALARGRDAS